MKRITLPLLALVAAVSFNLLQPSSIHAQQTQAQTSWQLGQSSDCGAATTTLNCDILIPPANDLGVYPNMQISFNPETGLGTISFETFQEVENANGPYLTSGVIDLAAPVWNTVVSNGQTSYQITDLTLYGYGSYATDSGLPPCQGPVNGKLPSNCWDVKPTTLHFTYTVIYHPGGSYTWERGFKNGALTFAQIQ